MDSLRSLLQQARINWPEDWSREDYIVEVLDRIRRSTEVIPVPTKPRLSRPSGGKRRWIPRLSFRPAVTVACVVIIALALAILGVWWSQRPSPGEDMWPEESISLFWEEYHEVAVQNPFSSQTEQISAVIYQLDREIEK